ncbi:uncharacterized protein [Amphiura filiformis]|uniref:uncharacterized protein n=1 Tax=Amphiura filiformis TaxID=82378 RepID=UPI003B21020B
MSMYKSNHESGINHAEQLRIMDSQLDQLERENTRLVDQLKEVIRMNTHWQRYDAQREEYVVKLTKTNRELQDKVADLQHQISEFDKDLEAKKERPNLSDLAFESLQVEDEESKDRQRKTGHLESLLLRKEEEIAALTDHVAQLKDRIAELENGKDTRRKKEDEKVLLLQEQVNVCMEDFKQERKDRERCHDENMRLKDRLAQVENDLRANEEQLFVYQEQIKRLQERCRYKARRTYDEPCCCPNERPRPRHQVRQVQQPYYYGDDFTELPSDVEIDGGPKGTRDDDYATTDSTNDEIDGVLEKLQDDTFVTIQHTDYEIDGVSEGPQDDIHATMVPTCSDVKINGEEPRLSDMDVIDGRLPIKHTDDDDIYGSPKGSKDETDGAPTKPGDVDGDILDDFSNDCGIDLNNNNDDGLQCPRCLISFDVHQHCELLDHVNTCMG